jgi:thiosulfate/3-mercaptopyruvate sulfurtransferase
MRPLLSPSGLRAFEGDILLLDARRASAYAEGHLPGALFADLDRQLSRACEPGHDPAKGGRHPLPSPETWARQLGAWGIHPGLTVVAYDDAGGGNAAARLWWMLRAAGHSSCAVLDGGLQAALAEGWALTGEVDPREACPSYPVATWAMPTIRIEEAARLGQAGTGKLLDVRSGERYRGETEPLDPVAGHIPGALNRCYLDNLGPDGRFKDPASLRDMYLELLKDTPPERLAVHCGSGVTACHTLLALEAAGLPGASLYVGSWSEWCRSGRPIAIGERP